MDIEVGNVYIAANYNVIGYDTDFISEIYKDPFYISEVAQGECTLRRTDGELNIRGISEYIVTTSKFSDSIKSGYFIKQNYKYFRYLVDSFPKTSPNKIHRVNLLDIP